MEKKIVIILCVLDVILLGFSIFLYVGEDRTRQCTGKEWKKRRCWRA